MSILLLLLLCLCLPWLLICSATSPNQVLKHYVIYMGATNPSSNENRDSAAQAAELAHLELLSTIIPGQERERISIIHNYKHAFRGFSAMLTEDEASLLSGHRDVVSVFPDTTLQLHTTRSWDFIEGKAGRLSRSRWGIDKHETSEIIIGILDTGIWPESPSFHDKGMGPIPSRWKGVCMEGPDFDKSNCNRKLIGARYYSGTEDKTSGSPRDPTGHGTHVASTAAGAPVTNASYFGLARGTARGGAPSARIASYRVCSTDGCSGAAIMQAIDDAVNDGVDVISLSIGFSGAANDYFEDSIAIGAFHAEQKGVMVICSAGNDGPDPYTVGNTAPWLFTVAASTLDRDFQSTVLLGNGRVLKGTGVNFSKLSRSAIYPLILGKDAAANSSVISEARKCYPVYLDIKKVAGKIVVCVDDGEPFGTRRIRRLALEHAEGKGVIFILKEEEILPSLSGIFPYTEVGNITGSEILNYIKSTKKPTSTILPTVEIPRQYRPAPVVALFSSRGPGGLTENILKPDVMAPGVSILAAMPPKIEETTGNETPEFSLRSGTSMACPHVSGAAAFIKSVRRQWTSSMIKSALMTTATTYDNTRKLLTNSSSCIANPHEAGAGELNPIKALNPGLVFETTTQDYLKFLCYYGYSKKLIKGISNTNFKCPKNSNHTELISNINYPSISISTLNRNRSKVVTQRTMTNVGPSNSTYNVKVQSPKGLVVKVIPEKIVFKKGLKRVPFEVSFYGKKAPSGYNYGSITWFDGRHSVRVVFAVNVH